MTRPIVLIHDAMTNSSIEREMNDAEFAQYQIDQETAAQAESDRQAKALARQNAISKLSNLGLTESEINAIIGGA